MKSPGRQTVLDGGIVTASINNWMLPEGYPLRGAFARNSLEHDISTRRLTIGTPTAQCSLAAQGGKSSLAAGGIIFSNSDAV